MIYDFDDLNFKIISVGRFKHEVGSFFVAERPYAALGFRVSGSGSFDIGGESFVSGPGDVLFIPKNVSYNVDYTGGESIVVHFSDCNYGHSENFGGAGEALKKHFEILEASWKNGRGINGIKSVVYEILQKLADISESNEFDTIKNCTELIERRFRSPELDIREICASCGVSETTLRRCFKSKFGVSPKRYIIELRMKYALDLLAEGRYSVKDVAHMSGFEDEKYFSGFVKKYFGSTPTRLKNKFKI